MPEKNISEELIKRYLDGTITPEDKALVESWHLEDLKSSEEQISHQEIDSAYEQMRNTIIAHTVNVPIRTVRLWPRMAAAASVALILGAAALYIVSRHNKSLIASANDVAPGNAVAILKTGGRIIQLDKTNNGVIASQNHTSIIKTKGEQLAYEIGAEDTKLPVYDTIQVPAGGRPYTIKLSDGSRITLNAATTLRYPESFSKTTRGEVELITGEVYAEVAHNDQAPFRIKAHGQLVEDIGTEFNISAYPDEKDIRTTLVNGKVKVSANAQQKILVPGQQSILAFDQLSTITANLEQTIAWKNGDFIFNGENIQVIMRQLARWYNVEVKYEGQITTEVFYGRVTRKKNISEVLRMLEKTQKVHFKVEGRRVTVLSKI